MKTYEVKYKCQNENLNDSSKEDVSLDDVMLLVENNNPFKNTMLENIIIKERKEMMVSKLLSSLSERELFVIQQLIFNDNTLYNVGKCMGVCRQRVLQIKTKALARMKRVSKRNDFKQHLEGWMK